VEAAETGGEWAALVIGPGESKHAIHLGIQLAGDVLKKPKSAGLCGRKALEDAARATRIVADLKADSRQLCESHYGQRA